MSDNTTFHRNDITGDLLRTKIPSQAYRDNWDAIFSNTKKEHKDVHLNNSCSQDKEKQNDQP